ncbi:hypothetical protein ABPG74_006746 [Tetrahymena malaccensis]
MAGLEIWQKQLIANLRDQVSEECPFNKPTLEKLFFLLNEQKPHFKNLEYLNDGAFSLVLKAKNTIIQKEVALKIIDCTSNKLKSGIQALKQEYEMLKKFKYNKHIVQVYDCFYLYDDSYDDEYLDDLQKEQFNNIINKDEERIDGQIDIKQKDSQLLEQNNDQIQRKIETFLILEMEICKYNLKDLFKQMAKNEHPNQEIMKIDIAIQMLDGLNTLHSHNIIHRDIKPQNFLVVENDQQKIVVKLCDLGFASQVSQSKSYKSAKGTELYFAPENEDGQSRIQSDLFSLGLVLLELDNLALFDRGWIKKQELIDLYNGQGQLKQTINLKSKLYKIIETCLKPKYTDRKSASELLYQLTKQHKYDFDIYSTIIEEKVEKQVKEMIRFYNNEHQNTKSLPLSEDDFIKVFQEIFKKKRYSQNMTIIGFGCFGIALCTKNQTDKEIVIKIQKVEDQMMIEKEIEIMNQAQSPNVIQFFSSYFIEGLEQEIQKDNQTFIKKEKYVVFELERCTCSLKEYLERQTSEGEITCEEKMNICLQILKAVHHIHSKNIIHNDIKPDNFLIIIDQDKKNVQVRLCDFGLAIKLKQEEELIEFEDGILGAPAYQSPDFQNNKKVYSKQSDTFAVGLVLTQLDNHLQFQDIFSNYFISYMNMMQQYFNVPFENNHRINRHSQIYQQFIVPFLVYDRQQRGSIGVQLKNYQTLEILINQRVDFSRN